MDQTARSSSRLDLLVLAMFVAVVAFVMAGSPGIFDDGDVSWHVASGRWILDHHSVPATDPFSFTAFGQRWIAQEWLADLLSALAVHRFGEAGLTILVAVALAGLFLIVGLELRRWAEPVQLGATLLALSLILGRFTLARPHLFAWPLLAGWLVLLIRARDEHGAPRWWAVALMLLWANLHASYFLGLALAAWFAIEALVEESDKVRALRQWLPFGLALLIAALCTPNGPDGLAYPVTVMRMSTLPMILEWRPSNGAVTPLFGPVVVALLALFGLRGVKVRPARLALVALLLLLAFHEMRQQPVWAIAAAILLARPIAEAFGPVGERAPLWRTFGLARPRPWLIALAGGALLLVVAVMRGLVPVARPQSSTDPAAAIAHVPPALRRQPVLNSYDFGGPLIAAGIRPFIDGRSDLYGDRFVAAQGRIDSGDPAAFARAVRDYRLAWAITDPANQVLVRTIEATPGWHRLYADPNAIIDVRDAPLGPPLPPLPASNGR